MVDWERERAERFKVKQPEISYEPEEPDSTAKAVVVIALLTLGLLAAMAALL